MKGKHVNFLHIPGQGLGVLLIRIFIKTEIRSFWVRTPKGTVPECTKIGRGLLVKYTASMTASKTTQPLLCVKQSNGCIS